MSRSQQAEGIDSHMGCSEVAASGQSRLHATRVCMELEDTGRACSHGKLMSSLHVSEIKYVFLDVVDFTQNRHTGAQAEIVEHLNGVIKNLPVTRECRFLPTGDGMCIAVLGTNIRCDQHLVIAQQILSGVHESQTALSDIAKYRLRIGISENKDAIIQDINGQQNFAGAGINQAQRAMAAAGRNQIFATRSVFDSLHHHPEYWQQFRERIVTDKHGNEQNFYQFVRSGVPGLNIDFVASFTPFEARYLAAAIRSRNVIKEMLMEKDGELMAESIAMALYFSATDECDGATAKWRKEDGVQMKPFREQVLRYDEARPPLEIGFAASEYICERLARLEPYFETRGFLEPVLISEVGLNRVYRSPGLVRELGLPPLSGT